MLSYDTHRFRSVYHRAPDRSPAGRNRAEVRLRPASVALSTLHIAATRGERASAWLHGAPRRRRHAPTARAPHLNTNTVPHHTRACNSQLPTSTHYTLLLSTISGSVRAEAESRGSAKFLLTHWPHTGPTDSSLHPSPEPPMLDTRLYALPLSFSVSLSITCSCATTSWQ